MITPSPHELPDLVRDLHRSGSRWLPAGLASRLEWGPAVAPCRVVSCSGLNRILEHNRGDFTLQVEAGVPLAELQAALAPHRQWLSLDPPWGAECRSTGAGSIGGLVARGLAGGYRQRYLGVRDQIIGLRLLRCDGVTARAGGRVVKNVAGYDLMRLFCGSWGSLGLITELTLRTLPLPPERRGLLVQGPLPELAALSRWLLRSSLVPERIDWWSAPLAAAAGLERLPLLLIGLASVERSSLADQLAALQARTPLPGRVLAEEELGRLLTVARGAETSAAGGTPSPSWLLRLGVAPDRAEKLLADAGVARLRLELGAGGGLGMAWPDPGVDLRAREVLELRRLCRRLGGHLTILRRPAGAAGGTAPAWEDAPSRPLIEAVKRQFDPHGQLGPGRLPGVARPCADHR